MKCSKAFFAFISSGITDFKYSFQAFKMNWIIVILENSSYIEEVTMKDV